MPSPAVRNCARRLSRISRCFKLEMRISRCVKIFRDSRCFKTFDASICCRTLFNERGLRGNWKLGRAGRNFWRAFVEIGPGGSGPVAACCPGRCAGGLRRPLAGRCGGAGSMSRALATWNPSERVLLSTQMCCSCKPPVLLFFVLRPF